MCGKPSTYKSCISARRQLIDERNDPVTLKQLAVSGETLGNNSKTQLKIATTEPIPSPTAWPNANARLLGLGVGLPVKSLDRLAQFSPLEFERFTLEWATDYLSSIEDVVEVQQRGGAGDKGRDVIVWLDSSDITPRRWRLYQCKHYATRLPTATASTEIGKVLYYTFIGDYSPPEEYWFVTHLGVVGTLQDLLDEPSKLKAHILANWSDHCADKKMKESVSLSAELTKHIEAFDFSIFKAKQPLDLINEHAKTRYHLPVFGLPLIDRPKPPAPPSTVGPGEMGYVSQLFDVIGENLGISVGQVTDFAHSDPHRRLFERSRITFYCAENLKELARDQMADAGFFETLVDEFHDGLYHVHTDDAGTGLKNLKATIQAAQSLQLGGHALSQHVSANDREGICHHMANDDRVRWCKT